MVFLTRWLGVTESDAERNLTREASDIEEIARMSLLMQMNAAAQQHRTLCRGTHAKGVCARARFEVFDVTVERDPVQAARLAKGIFAKPGLYPAVVRFANADPNINSDFKPDVRSLSFSVDLTQEGVAGEDPSRQDFSMQNATTLPINDSPAFLATMKLLTASNQAAGLWSLPFKDKLRVLRTLTLAELQARQTIKPYQQLRYWSTVPFRHGPNEVVKFSATPSPDNPTLLVVIPLSEKYLSLVKGFLQQGPKALPVLIPIDSAGAIADAERAYESFDVPKGTLRGSPPVPEDDLTTLRTSLYLVAQKKLGSDLIASLTQTIMRVRRDLLAEQPIFAQITSPSTDADAYLPLHPGAAAFYNGTQQSFMDEYGNWIYLTPMILGGAATVLAAAWKFLGLGSSRSEGPLDSLYALGRRIRNVGTEAELSDIEEEIDEILKAQRARSAAGDESAVDDATLNVAAHRLESLIHDRRTILAKKPAIVSAA
jgi:hypothetical protein